jgi:hypothetical protein
MPDELETILRLVADGHLKAADAAPIIEMLQRATVDTPDGEPGPRAADGEQATPRGESPDRPGGRRLRVEVTEEGRQVVNLRIPLGLASLAVDRVPGLPGQYRESIRSAVRAGLSGPIVDVGDDEDRVRVILE